MTEVVNTLLLAILDPSKELNASKTLEEIGNQYLPQIEILKEQIDYLKVVNETLKTENEVLNNDYKTLTQAFNSFTSTVNLIFGIFALLIAASTGVGSFLGFKSIEPTIENIVGNRVDKAVARRIESRVEQLEKLTAREVVLDESKIIYYIPSPNSKAHPPEFVALERRFKNENVELKSSLGSEEIKSNILVLDLENSIVSDEEGSEEGIELIKKIEQKIQAATILVIYTSNNRSPLVDFLRQSKDIKLEYVAANSKATLMTRVVDSAYISDALK